MTKPTKTFLVQDLPIDEVIPFEKNPRLNDQSVEKVAASLDEFGWQQPIVVDEQGIVIAGHTRLKAARRLGWEFVPVKVAKGLSPEQVAAYRLMDNKAGEDSEWEDEMLADILRELQAADYELDLTGFDDEEIDKLLAEDELDQAQTEVLLDQAVQLKPQREYVVVQCGDDGGQEFELLRELLSLGMVRKGGYKHGSAFDAPGVQRVVEAAVLIEMLKGVADAGSDSK